MMQILFSFLLAIFRYSAYSQRSLSEQDNFIKSKSIYLNFDNGQMSYFTKKIFRSL